MFNKPFKVKSNSATKGADKLVILLLTILNSVPVCKGSDYRKSWSKCFPRYLRQPSAVWYRQRWPYRQRNW